MQTYGKHQTISDVKTCYRCGSEFRTSGGRVCSSCRKPRVQERNMLTRGDLSVRARQIAHLVHEAKQNKEIGHELHLTEGTVKEYLNRMNRMFRKLTVKNRTELAIWAIRNLPATTD